MFLLLKVLQLYRKKWEKIFANTCINCLQYKCIANICIYMYTHTYTLWSWFHKYIFVSKVAHFKYVQFVKCESHSVMSNYLRSHRLYSLWNSPGQNTGVGNCSLLQGVFLTQELNWCLPHGRRFFTTWATREAHFKYMHFIVCQLYLIKLLQHNGREMNLSNDFSCSSPQDLQPNCPGHYKVVGGNK